MVAFGHRVPIHSAALDGFRIGPLSPGPVPAGVGDLSCLKGVRIDAIVGLDVLVRTSFAIDYRARVLKLSPAVPADSTVPLEVTWPFLTVRMTTARHQIRLLVDTGSRDLVLFTTRAAAVLSDAPWRGDKTVQYASGRHACAGSTCARSVSEQISGTRSRHGRSTGCRTDTRLASTECSACWRWAATECGSTSSRASSDGAADHGGGGRPLTTGVECCRPNATSSRALPDSFRIGEFHVEPSLHSVSGPAGSARVEPKVMLVLLCLAEHGGQVVTKDRLMRVVWPDTFVGDDVLTRAISELRRVFGDDVRDPRFIQTVPKSGYRLIARVSFTSADDNSAVTAQAAHIEMLPSRHDAVAAHAEAKPTLVGPGTRRRSWTRGLAIAAVVVAVLLMGAVVQRMIARPSARVVRSIQLTFTGQVASPALRELEFFPVLATDGGRIYFTETIGNRHTLAQASVSGGETVTIPTPFSNALLLNVSPDGSRLLVREFDRTQLEGSLWVIPIVGGAALRLGDIVAHDGGWSPDGTRLVFARGEELYVASGDGSEPRKLAAIPGRAVWLRWSPDGARLRFTVIGAEGNTRSLWEVSAEGHGLRQLPLGRREHDLDCCGEWSPDGRHFFFTRFRDDRADIWVLPERKGLFGGTTIEPARLTSGPLQFAVAVPARDGRLLAIGGQLRGGNVRFDLDKREFAPYEAAGWAGWFAFSRDGEWMAYVQYRLTETTLWRSRVDGTERRQLTQPPLRLLLPRWSPDGRRIAFMGRTPGQPWRIYAIGAEGGVPQLMIEGERSEADPDWAPDGQSLIFGRPPDYLAATSEPKAIHLLDLRTRELSTLPGSEGLFAPRWSPGGRYVAALTLDQTTLLLFDRDTRTWTELGRFKTVHHPVWSRDERFLYFEVVDEESIYRIRMSDRAVEKVVDLRGARKSAYWFCVFEGLAADESPLISCAHHDPDIYALDWEMR